MLGRIILAVLGVLLLALAAALLLPVRIRFSYDQGALNLWVRYGPLRLQLFPRAEKAEEPAPQTVEEPPEKKKKRQKKKRPKKPRARINLDQILYSLETLPPILGRALRRTGQRVRVGPLQIHLLIACGDPADTAQLFGKLQAALGAALPLVHQVVRIEDQDIQLFADFTGDRVDCIADVGLSLRPWDLVSVGVRAGGSVLKWFLGFRRLASPPPREQKQAAPETAAEQKADNEAA